MTLLDSTAQTLKCTEAGSRLWFCFCPSAEPMLLVTSFRDDPGMKTLWSQILSAFPEQAPMSRGVAHMNQDGRLRLMAPSFAADTLPRLAGWVKANIAEHPGLQAAINPTLLTVDASGTVRRYHTEPDLWQGLTAATVPGSTAHTEGILARIKPGRRAWFWMTDAGIGGRPTLLCVPQRSDPEGAVFAEQTRAIVRRMPSIGTAVHGVLLRTAARRLALLSEAPEATTRAICAAVATAHPALSDALIGSTATAEGEGPTASLDDLDSLMNFDF